MLCLYILHVHTPPGQWDMHKRSTSLINGLTFDHFRVLVGVTSFFIYFVTGFYLPNVVKSVFSNVVFVIMLTEAKSRSNGSMAS